MIRQWPLRTSKEHRESWSRLLIVLAGFAFIYTGIATKLVYLGHLSAGYANENTISAKQQASLVRPDILDRNGEVLATDIKTFSVFMELRGRDARHMTPSRVDETIAQLATVLPQIQYDTNFRKRLLNKSGFIWVKRGISSEKRRQIFNLGIPGLRYIEENTRFYPNNHLAAHILGYVDIDNRGVAGLEKYLDTNGSLSELHGLNLVSDPSELKAKRLSIDMRIQHIVRDEISVAMRATRAIAGVGIVLDAQTSEVLAMVSLPDFNLNYSGQYFNDKDKMNRATAGNYEMGSVFKVFNTAIALDLGHTRLSDIYPVHLGLQVGKHRINEFKSKGRPLNIQEIFIYSSNTGSAILALKSGAEAQRQYFAKLGFFERLNIELPESRLPQYPRRASDIGTVTMAFGYGISVTPLHVAAAGAAMVNGGVYVRPTFFPRSQQDAQAIATRVIRPDTSQLMRRLFRLAVEQGSGRRANALGYRVGLKTGTAEKSENGKYFKNRNRTSCLAAFPIDDPKYVVFVILDEPTTGSESAPTTLLAGEAVAPVVGKIVKRMAPIAGVMPKFDLPLLEPAAEVPGYVQRR